MWNRFHLNKNITYIFLQLIPGIIIFAFVKSKIFLNHSTYTNCQHNQLIPDLTFCCHKQDHNNV